MAANNQPSGNKSLYLYTALIFVVAILLIILSFFAMSNRDKQMNEIEETKSITEKASVLCEENKNLAEEIVALKSSNEKLSTDLLNIANEYYAAGDKDKAKDLTKNIDTEKLTDNQKTIYYTVTEQTPAPTATPKAQ